MYSIALDIHFASYDPTYFFRHSHVGIHKLPVLLKIDMGREVLVSWLAGI